MLNRLFILFGIMAFVLPSWGEQSASAHDFVLLAFVEGEELAAADAAEADHHDEHHDEGIPLDFKADLALWSGVTFILFLLLLRKFAWGPLVTGLDKRESRIRQDLADAEAARLRAEKMLAEHEAKLDKVQDEVREILAEARRDAERTKHDILAQAQADAEATQKRAIGEIERARDQAVKELFDVMAENVARATEHVLGRSLGDQDQERLIEEALSQFAERPV